MMLQISATPNDVRKKKSVWVDLYSYVCYAMMIYGANKPITCVLRAYGKLIERWLSVIGLLKNTKYQMIGNCPYHKVQIY